MRISDWSSDVCSSDLNVYTKSQPGKRFLRVLIVRDPKADLEGARQESDMIYRKYQDLGHEVVDRKSVVSGKSVSVRVDLGGRRIFKQKNTTVDKVQHISQSTTT